MDEGIDYRYSHQALSVKLKPWTTVDVSRSSLSVNSTLSAVSSADTVWTEVSIKFHVNQELREKVRR